MDTWKKQVIADALSRYPVFQPEGEDQADVLVQVLKVHEMDPALKVMLLKRMKNINKSLPRCLQAN